MNRSIACTAVIALGLAASAAGQSVVDSETRSASEGGTQLLVTNNYSAPATAIAIEALWSEQSGRLRAKHVTFADSLFRSRDELPPGQVRSFTFGNREGAEPWVCDVTLQAVVFADGTTFGDEAWVDLVSKRRRALLRGIDAVLESFSSPLRLRGAELRAYLESKKEEQLSLMKLQGADIHEILALRQAYNNALGNLAEKADDSRVQRVGSRFRFWRARFGEDGSDSHP